MKPRVSLHSRFWPENPNEDVNEVLSESIAKWSDDLDIELLEGLAGIRVYYIERLPRTSAVNGLVRIVWGEGDTPASISGSGVCQLGRSQPGQSPTPSAISGHSNVGGLEMLFIS